MSKPRKSGLGKGLDILFADNSSGSGDLVVTLRIAEIEPNREQPRRRFDEEALAELADSIKAHGVIQPLVVRPLLSGSYQIIAGERRWRASRMAGLSEIPAIIREMGDAEAMELALIENLQREDLNVMEEAQGYQLLITRYGMTQDQVAVRVGKSRPVVANAMRLLRLPEEIAGLVEAGELSAGHARALLAVEDPALMLELAHKAAAGELTVRDIERIAKKVKAAEEEAGSDQLPEEPPLQLLKRDPYYKEVELALGQELGRKIKVSVGKNRGVLEIEFYDKGELEELANRLASLRGQEQGQEKDASLQ